MASFHTWAALVLAAAYVARGAARWHYALHDGPRFVFQLIASVIVYGALTFLVIRLAALPIWILRSIRGDKGRVLRLVEAALPVAVAAGCMVTLEQAVAWNIELPQMIALSDPVRTHQLTKAVGLGLGAAIATGIVALLFARRGGDAALEGSPHLVKRLTPWILLLAAGGLVAQYALGLDARGIKSMVDIEREELVSERRLAVVCVDAATWHIVDRFVDEGRMPAMAELMDEGVRGHLVTWGQRLSPIVWTSMVTGMAEEKHGIHGFTEIVGDSRTPALTRSTSREVAALWNVTRAASTPTLVLNWLITDPPEPLDGVMISSLKGSIAGIAPPAYPEALRVGVQSILDEHPFESDGVGEGSTHSTDVVDEQMYLIDTVRAVYEMAASIDEYALVVTGTQTTDGVMHQRMLHAFPELYDLERWGVSEADLTKGADDLARAYQEADRFLGELVADGYTLLVVSDHGSRAPAQPLVTFSMNVLLADMGLARRGEEDENGRRRLDIDNSRAYVAGINELNSEVGLFFQENVTEGLETPSLQELLSTLRSLSINETGVPLFDGIVNLERKRAFPVLTRQGASAAILLGGAVRELPGERTITFAGETRPLSRYVQVHHEMNGTHEPHGLFLLAGPDIAARGALDSLCVKTSFGALMSWVIGSSAKATPVWRVARALGLVCPYTSLDVAPTALAFLGLPIADDMDGVIMAGALKGVPYSRRSVDSFAPLLQPVEAGQEVDEASDAAVMELLRNLGYVR